MAAPSDFSSEKLGLKRQTSCNFSCQGPSPIYEGSKTLHSYESEKKIWIWAQFQSHGKHEKSEA